MLRGDHVDTRRFLLGFVAVLVISGGAQAAELPVKAKPVQYVKVCTIMATAFITSRARRPA
jgi:hypothetical protein